MFVIIAWNPCATRYPWFFRKMYCSLEPFMKTSAGVMKLQAMKKSNVYVSLRRLRLCIARALLKKPKILILDDSTSAVDTKTDALIRKAFREEIPNTTKIIIAQRVSSIEDADQIIVLDGGQIMGIGTSEELLKTNEIYREVYESQVKGGDDHE